MDIATLRLTLDDSRQPKDDDGEAALVMVRDFIRDGKLSEASSTLARIDAAAGQNRDPIVRLDA